AALQARLARVGEQGYEAMASQQVAGVINLSVPVFGPLGSVVAALTCPYTERLDKKDAPDQAEALRLLVAAGQDISQRSVTKE
ncbi:MAG: IclR family transcriptional regulator C-terminal domain-containing protein, partial [Devosia sp.]|nr:IclR family transcriptional regulator C-terminal domain-containing protein [Devosia sp.]